MSFRLSARSGTEWRDRQSWITIFHRAACRSTSAKFLSRMEPSAIRVIFKRSSGHCTVALTGQYPGVYVQRHDSRTGRQKTVAMRAWCICLPLKMIYACWKRA